MGYPPNDILDRSRVAILLLPEWLCCVPVSSYFPSKISLHDAGSISPEDKFGPGGPDPLDTPGGSELRYLSDDKILGYRTEFWNAANATVPTQDAITMDTLDITIYDTSTFEFTRIGFLAWNVPLLGINSTTTDATFTGKFDHTYESYSVAIDNLGNVEAVPLEADAPTAPSITGIDVNRDDHVNVLDMILVAQHWGQSGSPRWIA